MSGGFFDSNVLLYGFAQNDSRSLRAHELIEIGGAISTQCLNEFASVARRKIGMDWDRVDAALANIVELCSPIVAIDLRLNRLGLNYARRYRLSVYDGLIVAAAMTAGCEILYSEDMHHGLVIDRALTITNPFRAA